MNGSTDMGALSIGLMAAAVVMLCTAPMAKAEPAPPAGGPGSLDGIWNNVGFTPIRAGIPDGPASHGPATAQGDPLPMTPWAANLLAERRAPGSTYADEATRKCIHPGMPYGISTSALSPIQIVEAPRQKQITVLYEQFTGFRIINMDQAHPAHPTPNYMGDAVGHWDGDTLVIDTIAISEGTTILDVVPHSDQMHLVERMRRTGPGTMEDVMTIEDPKAFTKPWTMIARFKQVPGMRMAEFLCQNNPFGTD